MQSCLADIFKILTARYRSCQHQQLPVWISLDQWAYVSAMTACVGISTHIHDGSGPLALALRKSTFETCAYTSLCVFSWHRLCLTSTLVAGAGDDSQQPLTAAVPATRIARTKKFNLQILTMLFPLLEGIRTCGEEVVGMTASIWSCSTRLTMQMINQQPLAT